MPKYLKGTGSREQIAERCGGAKFCKKSILASSLGNTLEWLDFGLFIFLAPIIGKHFFPAYDSATATIATFGVFAAGFACRPLGGILFGHKGDTQGRAGALRLSMLIIAMTTLLVGLLPTYHSIGIWSPILFTILRIIQGISVGGEYSGVMIYLCELAPPKQRGFFTSFAATGANLGFLLATLLVVTLQSVFSTEIIDAWVWRLPFLLIGCIGFVILYFRLKLPETLTYQYLVNTHHVNKMPFITALRSAPKSLLKIFGLTCMGATFYYIFFGYMPEYLSQYADISHKTGLLIQSILLVAMLLFVPLAGFVGDYLGRKKMLMVTSLAIIVLSVPCFYLIQEKTYLAITLALTVAMVLSSMEQGNSLTAVVENCPIEVRYSGIAFSYNLGMALFGGTAPLVVSLLTENLNIISPAYYLMMMSGITLIAIFTLFDKKEADSIHLIEEGNNNESEIVRESQSAF